MTNWVARLADRFILELSRLYIVADPDRLLEFSSLRDLLHVKGFRIVSYGDPVEFRFQFEDELRPLLTSDEGEVSGVIIVSTDVALTSIPFDILSDGRVESVDIGTIAPRLDRFALRDVPREHLDRVVAAYEQSELVTRRMPLSEAETRTFLIRDVYRVPVSTISTVADLVAYLCQRHYAGEELPESIDRQLAEKYSSMLPDGADSLELFRSRSAFFEWLQSEWRDYVVEASTRGIAEERVPFSYVPIRVYVDNLFSEGHLERIDVTDFDLPEWARPGVRLPADDPVNDARRLVEHIRGSMPDTASNHQRWMDFAWRWAHLRYRLATIDEVPTELDSGVRELQQSIETTFAIWLESRFGGLTTLPVATQPVVVSHIASVLRRRLDNDRRVALVVVDGMAIEHWVNVTHSASVPDDWLLEQSSCFAWIPTLTSISRQSIFSGRPPRLFSDTWNTTAKEPAHWKRVSAEAGLPADAAHFARIGLQKWNSEDGLRSSVPEVLDPRLRMLAVVINDLDELAHANILGVRQMHQDIAIWASTRRFHGMIEELLDLGFTVYVTSDHGSVDAVGEGQPKEGELVEQRAVRARLYVERVFAERVERDTPHARLWPSVGLPEDVHVLVAEGLTAFSPPSNRVIAHGGVSLEEVVVPFIRIWRES